MKQEFLKRVIYNWERDVCLWYMVSFWACDEVTLANPPIKEASSVLLCVRIFSDITSPTSWFEQKSKL